MSQHENRSLYLQRFAPNRGRALDVTRATDDLSGLEPESFDFITCSALERARKPWAMAETLQGLLKPGGRLYIVTPWVWRYQQDYYRFSSQAIEALFDALRWNHFYYSSTKIGLFPARPEKDDEKSIDHEGIRYLPPLELHGLGKKHAGVQFI